MNKVTNKELEILMTLMGGRELYGLEIVREAGVSRGSIYVLLSRLKEKGFVSSSLIDEPLLPGKQRPRYNITGNGRLAVNAQIEYDRILTNGIIIPKGVSQ